MPETFRPIRPFKSWPRFNPRSFDPRENVFIPDLAVDNRKIQSVSPRKIDLIGAKVYRTTTQSIVATTVTALAFDAEEYDDGSFHDSSANTRLSIPYDGIYSVMGFAEFANGANTDRRIFIYANGAEILRTKWPVTGALTTEMFLSYTGRFRAGDYIELMVRHDAAANLAVSAGATGNFFAATYQGTI